jgi:putative multiple sugar transport system substrate-binding protein
MQNLLAKSYSSGQKVDGILSPYDGISIGIISALTGAGYGGSGTKLPIITGQDAEIPSVKSIIAGQQYSTIYKDTRQLADESVKMANDVLTGKTPEVNDTKSYNNKVKVVPSYLFQPVVVTKDNYQKVLVDSGYYSASDLK